MEAESTIKGLVKNTDGFEFISKTLESWGICMYAGVTGGGVIHFLKDIPPLKGTPGDKPEFLNLAEYGAGFMPLGYYLAKGEIAAAVATTGAATKLIGCGLSDCKYHDIPAVYIVPISNPSEDGLSPLQDTSKYGNNILEQLKAELPDSVFVFDNPTTIGQKLSEAKVQLDKSKPVVFVLDNEVLGKPLKKLPVVKPTQALAFKNEEIKGFIEDFRKSLNGKRLVVLVGEEMARYKDAKNITTLFCQELKPATIWSMNGANAIARDNAYGYGYISFGGNDKAMSIYKSLNKNDVLLVLGASFDEYTVNLKEIKASHTFFAGNIPDAYTLVNNSMKHVVKGEYTQIMAPLDIVLKQITESAKANPFANKPVEPAPINLNDKPFAKPREGFVDMAILYQQLDNWWPSHSIAINDVCLAYKDHQYVVQRPNDNIMFYSLYRGSAMGGAYGIAIGAKLANPKDPVFLFTGDGCFRLFAGSMGEVRNLGMVMFVLNNKDLSIVGQGLDVILPDVPEENYHSYLHAIDYCGVAKACGWDAEKLDANLLNLDSILKKINGKMKRSLLIEIPVDPQQLLGSNPRLENL